MTRKEELIDQLSNTELEKTVVFVEKLDDGRQNFRTMLAPRAHIIGLLDTYFDDDLKGDFKDGVKTEIHYVYFEEPRFVEAVYKEE